MSIFSKNCQTFIVKTSSCFQLNWKFNKSTPTQHASGHNETFYKLQTNTCRGPVTLCPPSFSSFRRTNHHHHHHHYRHHPTPNSSLSGQNQAIWKQQMWGGFLLVLYWPIRGRFTWGQHRAVSSSLSACYDEGTVSGHSSTALRGGGGHGAKKKQKTSSATYSLPAWETLERWGQRWRGQRSVEDDTEHGASTEGWEPVRLGLREQTLSVLINHMETRQVQLVTPVMVWCHFLLN